MSYFRFPVFLQSILVSVQNDRGMEVIIIRGGTLIVIRRASKESAAVVRKAVRCHSEQERRRLSDYLLLHKVFNTKRNLKSKIKKKFIFVSQRNSEIKKII